MTIFNIITKNQSYKPLEKFHAIFAAYPTRSIAFMHFIDVSLNNDKIIIK